MEEHVAAAGQLEIDNQKERLQKKTSYWKEYIYSVFLAPIGVYYFVKYFFFAREDDSRKAAVICLVLTIASIVVNVWLILVFLNQPIPGGNQNLEMLKELITPANQNTLLELLK